MTDGPTIQPFVCSASLVPTFVGCCQIPSFFHSPIVSPAFHSFRSLFPHASLVLFSAPIGQKEQQQQHTELMSFFPHHPASSIQPSATSNVAVICVSLYAIIALLLPSRFLFCPIYFLLLSSLIDRDRLIPSLSHFSSFLCIRLLHRTFPLLHFWPMANSAAVFFLCTQTGFLA